MKKRFTLWVFLAIFLGIVLGSITGQEMGIGPIKFFSLYDLGSKLFMNALTLVVVPLVASSIITSVAQFGKSGSFGAFGSRMIGVFIVTNFLAIATGMLITNLFHGAIHHSADAMRILEKMPLAAHVAESQYDFVAIIAQIIPPNIFEAFSKGLMLGIIFFSIFFGFALTKIEPKLASSLQTFFEALFNVMIQMTHLIIRLLPIGVFFLIAKQFALTGVESLRPLLIYFLVVLCAFTVFLFIVLSLTLKFWARVNPWKHLKAMTPALIAAFSTSSSAACLPITIDCAEKRAKIDSKICSLVIPLGSSLNLAGSAIYVFISVIFVAQVYGIEVHIATQILIFMLTLLLSMGEAGVPSASLVIIVAILNTLGLPPEGIGVFLAIDRILDMCRTTINVYMTSCSAAVVARKSL